VKGGIPVEVLKIRWQRLVFQGQTCPRCAETEEQVDKAFQILKQCLTPLGIGVTLDKKVLTPETFARHVME
jgi:hypothetical protein